MEISRPYVQDYSTDISGAPSCLDQTIFNFGKRVSWMPHNSSVNVGLLIKPFCFFTIFQHHNLAADCSVAIDPLIVLNVPTGLQPSICYRFQLLQFNCLFVLVLSLHITEEIDYYLVYYDEAKA